MAPEILYDLLALREAIFVVEQTCIYHELDGLDKIAQHLLLKHDDDVIACLRLLPPFEKEPRVRIGRVAVSKKWRKQGIARVMMHKPTCKASIYPWGLKPAVTNFLKTESLIYRCNYRTEGFS
jgi:predicted GNAT family N-acyltransferase